MDGSGGPGQLATTQLPPLVTSVRCMSKSILAGSRFEVKLVSRPQSPPPHSTSHLITESEFNVSILSSSEEARNQERGPISSQWLVVCQRVEMSSLYLTVEMPDAAHCSLPAAVVVLQSPAGPVSWVAMAAGQTTRAGCVPAGPLREACPHSFISSSRSAFLRAFSKLFFAYQDSRSRVPNFASRSCFALFN